MQYREYRRYRAARTNRQRLHALHAAACDVKTYLRDPVLTEKEPERWRSWRARERELITGVWGRSPQWGPGAKPLVVRGSGGEAPLKLKAF